MTKNRKNTDGMPRDQPLLGVGGSGEFGGAQALAQRWNDLANRAQRWPLEAQEGGLRVWELKSIGSARLAPHRGLGAAPLMISATIGAVIGAGALAVLWPAADASRHSIMPPVSGVVVANTGAATPTPPELPRAFPATSPVQYDPPPNAQHRPATEPVKVAEKTAPRKPNVEPPATVTKQIGLKRHRHKIGRVRVRRMWAWNYRDERYPRFGRIFR